MFGWCRRGEYWRIPVRASPARRSPTGQRTTIQTVDDVVLAADVAAEREEHERHGEQEADAHREEERSAVLLDRGRSRSIP